tara:strand:- start:3381 stop:4235 length:855 start_codon:yes stop_codon:yes gene_type:complete
MNELKKVFDNRKLAESTKNTYQLNYNKLVDELEQPIIKSSPSEIKKAIDFMSENPNTRWSMYSVPILIYNSHNMNPDKLINFREQLRKERKIKTAENLVYKFHHLPTMSHLKNKLNELFREKEYRKYIINFLLMSYGLRNKDLNLFITDDINKVDHKNNWIYVSEFLVEMYISDYKTSFKYGRKNISITSRKAKKALQSMTNQYLLTKQNGVRIHATSLNRFITKRTIDNLSESDIFKIIISTIRKRTNFRSLIKQFSEYRGTDVGTILQYYLPSSGEKAFTEV